MSKIPSSIIGACGEHYVSALLSSLGLIVALPRGGVPSTDLIVTNDSCGRSVSLQVKTGSSPLNVKKRMPNESYYAWDTGKKAIGLCSESLWYAYVDLNGWPYSLRQPNVFFVPSVLVSEVVENAMKRGEKRLFFWFYEREAVKYAGHIGAQPLIEYLSK